MREPSGQWLKALFAGLSLTMLNACTAALAPAAETQTHRVHHLAIIWLKKSGDETARQQYIEASKALRHLPGVLAYEAGPPVEIKRSHASSALDESYDIAVSAVFDSTTSFTAFLENPEYRRVAMYVLRPLVDKYKVYDFVD